MIRGASFRVTGQRRDGTWPRVYRMRRGQRLLIGGAGVVLIAGGLAGSLAILANETRGPSAWALLPLLLSALGAYLVAAVRAERLVLYEDAIELTELGKGTRRLRRDEIAGLRWIPLQYGQVQLVLELRGGRRPFKLGWVHETDPVLDGWLAAIPNLDQEERAREEAELLRSPALGASEPERVRALARARKIARALTGVAVAACAWGWLYPRPYPVAVATLGALPLVGLALLLGGRGRYAFDSGRRVLPPGARTDPRPSLVVAIMFPGLVLGLRGIQDLHVLDWKPLLAGAAVGGMILAAAIAVGDPKARKAWVLGVLVPLLAFHPWGALALANALLDRGALEVYRVSIRGKHVSSGKHTSYDLTLDPWGPVTEARSEDVGRALYEAVRVGGHVCVALRPGALGVRWYVVRRC
jgi:hypothetical protein